MLKSSDVGRLFSISIRPDSGIPKFPVAEARLIEDFGLEGDAHAGRGARQVSILEKEFIDEMRGLGMPIGPGVMGENLLVGGLSFPLSTLPLAAGARLEIGPALLEVVGERTPCASLNKIDKRLLKRSLGRCGILARVIRGGVIRPGDPVHAIQPEVSHAAKTSPPRRDQKKDREASRMGA